MVFNEFRWRSTKEANVGNFDHISLKSISVKLGKTDGPRMLMTSAVIHGSGRFVMVSFLRLLNALTLPVIKKSAFAFLGVAGYKTF